MLVARLKAQTPRDDYLIACINPELHCLKGFSPGDESEEDLNKWLDERDHQFFLICIVHPKDQEGNKLSEFFRSYLVILP